MNSKPIKVALGTASVCAALAIALVSSCKKDKVEQLTSTTTIGTDVIDATIGGLKVPSTYTVAGAWKVDKTHSNIMWETKYYGTGAPLTGRFNTFDMFVKFDQANPANTTIKAGVTLSTFNTGESGRDGYNNCGPKTYMGVIFDTLSVDTAGVVTWTPRKYTAGGTDTAYFNSTSCVKYGTGYMVTGNFTFRGITKSIQMPMTYTGITTTTASGLSTNRAGLAGKFDINALTVFGVTSTSIADVVTIRVDCNMVTNKY